MPAERVRVQRPARVDPFIWEHLPKAARAALASHFARTPEQALSLRLEAERSMLSAIQGAVSKLEKAMEKRNG